MIQDFGPIYCKKKGFMQNSRHRFAFQSLGNLRCELFLLLPPRTSDSLIERI